MNRRSRGVTALLALALGPAGTARAEEVDHDRLDARGFWVADTASEPWRPVRLAYPAAGGGWDAGVLVDVARNPLMEELPGGTEPVVDVLSSAHLYGGLAWRGMRFDAAMPFTLYGHDLGGGFAGTGDLRLGALLPAFEPDGTRPGLAVQASTWLPTGTASRYSGSPGVSAAAVVAVAQELGVVGWTLNGGLRVGRTAEARNLVAGSGPVGGGEVHLRLGDDLAIGGGAAVQGATGTGSVPVELNASLRFRTRGGGFAVLGVARGVGDGVGASGGRVFFAAGWGRRPPDEPPRPWVVPLVINRPRVVVEETEAEEPVAVLVDDRIVVSEQVFFREARADVLPGSEPVLRAVLGVLQEHPEVQLLLVEGHTNSRGSRRYNRRLSEARARAVVDWLVAHGADPDRLLWKGMGEDHPLVPDSDPAAMIVNRRVEFKVLRSDEEGVQPRVPSLDEVPVAARQDP